MNSDWLKMRKREVAARFGDDYLQVLAESGDSRAKKVLGDTPSQDTPQYDEPPQGFDCEWCLARYRVCSLEKDEYDNECIFIKRK